MGACLFSTQILTPKLKRHRGPTILWLWLKKITGLFQYRPAVCYLVLTDSKYSLCPHSLPGQYCKCRWFSGHSLFSVSLFRSLSLSGHHTMLICPHASCLRVACCKGCRHSNVFHVAVINMLIFLISHLKPAVSFFLTVSALFLFCLPQTHIQTRTLKKTLEICLFCPHKQVAYDHTITWKC